MQELVLCLILTLASSCLFSDVEPAPFLWNIKNMNKKRESSRDLLDYGNTHLEKMTHVY